MIHLPDNISQMNHTSYEYVNNTDSEADNAILKATKTGCHLETEAFVDEMESRRVFSSFNDRLFLKKRVSLPHLK